MKKVILTSIALFSISALQLQAHPALDKAKTEFNRSTFNFDNFLKEYNQAEANMDQFTPEERTEFQSLASKTIDMINKSIDTGKPVVRSASDIRRAADFHLGEAVKAESEGDKNRAEYHLNEFSDLQDQLPKARLEMRDPYENISRNFMESRNQESIRRRQSEDNGFDFVNDIR